MILGPDNSNQVIEVSLGWVDVIAIFSGIASLIMAVLAIWLSIVFYKMSDASSKEMKSSTEKINSNVEKLEKMFDTMYADTFSMVKDTVTHMRKQVDQNSDRMDNEIKSKVEELISKELVTVNAEDLDKQEIKDFIMGILKETKEIEKEIKKQNFKNQVIQILSVEGEKTLVYLEEKIIGKENDTEFGILFESLHEMSKEGFIDAKFTFDDDAFWLSATQPIRLLKSK